MGNEEKKKCKTEVAINNAMDIPDSKDYLNCHLLWLDKKVNNSENIDYKQYIEKIEQIKFSSFTEISDCIDKLTKIEFEKTFVLVSGSLAKDFFIEIEKNINKLKVIPVIMIFTSLRRTYYIKELIINLNYNLFDINLLFTDFDSIKKQLKIKDKNSPIENEKKEDEKKADEKQVDEKKKIRSEQLFFFEYIEDSKNLILPLYYRDYIDYPNKNEINEFNNFLKEIY